MASSALESELEEGLARMFTEEESHRTQQWIDWLDEITDLLDSESALFRSALQKLRYLCGRSNLLPKDCYISGNIELKHEHPASQGGFSDVYLGVLHRQSVALKVLRVHVDNQAQVTKAFCQEVIVWRRFAHPNIVRFLGVSKLFPLCLVSEWMPNGSIRSYINAHPDRDRTSWIIDTTRGLHYMHSLGLVHGDLKGANVLVNDNAQACLSDFGLAAVMHHTSSFTTKTAVMGSVRWMAPELLSFEGTDEAAGRPTTESDVYSLAMLWWEILSGNIPFPELRHDVQVLLKVVQGQHPPQPQVDTTSRDFVAFLWMVAERCLNGDPSVRPPVVQLKSEIEGWSTSATIDNQATVVQLEDLTNEGHFIGPPASLVPSFYGQAVKFAPSGSFCAFSCHIGEVKLWHFASPNLQIRAIPTAQDDHVTALAFSHDGTTLAIATMRGINLRSPQTGQAIGQPMTIKPHYVVHSMAFSRERLQLFAVLYDHQENTTRVRIWNTQNGRLLGSTEQIAGLPSAQIALSSEDAFIVFSASDRICMFSLLSIPPDLVHTWTAESSELLALTFAGDAVNYLRGSRWDTQLWNSSVDPDVLGVIKDFKLVGPADHSWRKRKATCACYSADGGLVAIGYDGGHIQVFYVSDGTPFVPILEETSQVAIVSIAFHPAPSLLAVHLASIDADGNCRLWYIPSGRPALTLTPDGHLLRSSGQLVDDFYVAAD